nr:unnamed protein product [Callosobruchus analis]
MVAFVQGHVGCGEGEAGAVRETGELEYLRKRYFDKRINLRKTNMNEHNSALKDDDFFKAVVKKVTDVIVKTLGEGISEPEQKIERIQANYSTVVNDLKEETALLESENDLLLKRRNIYDKKKMLEGSRVVIKEDLSEHRLKLMQYAIETSSLKNVRSYMGKIYIFKDNKRINVTCKEDVDKL